MLVLTHLNLQTLKLIWLNISENVTLSLFTPPQTHPLYLHIVYNGKGCILNVLTSVRNWLLF